MQHQPFRTAYIDAFAGARYRTVTSPADPEPALFPDLAEDASQQFLDGSARIALQVEPPFHRYIFIEKDDAKYHDLLRLKADFPLLADRIDVRKADANVEIQRLCRMNWRGRRAVLFLDPYGMQTQWDTIEAIATTRSIDLWNLWPLGMGLNRLLTRSGEIPEQWQNRLNAFLGTTDWFGRFYKVEPQASLLGHDAHVLVKARTDVLAHYLNERLGEVFAAVAPNPKVLFNSKGNPLYLLCFAVGNPSAAAIRTALDIASHILNMDD